MLRHRRWSAATAVAGAATVIVCGAGLADSAGTAALAATGPVSPTPAGGTPELANTGSTQTVRQLAQCGQYVYAVGSFTTIKRYSTTYTRNNVFRFSAASRYAVDTTWNPNVNGVVNSIAFTSDCSGAYIGGKFSSVHGTAVSNIAEISAGAGSAGAVVTTFKHSANGQVETLRRHQSHLFAGGYFTSINGNNAADPYMASLDATTGQDDGFIRLNISGNYHYCNATGTQCTSGNPTRVYNQQISHGGTLDLVEGDFTSVGGVPRQQIFMLNLATTPASVTGWTSPEWDGSDPAQPYQCAFSEPFYLQAAAWSSDDLTIYVATTGYKPWNLPAGSYPRTGLCDAAAAYPSTQTSVGHEWINYTGCDSLYAAAADAFAAYIGGHERWSQNPNGCDAQGPGAIVDPGMEGLVPVSGLDMRNSSGSALYTRSRGQGADDMLVTSAGLWIASDSGTVSKSTGKFGYSQTCGGVTSHSGICFLPYPS
jgi:hypothetical protein